MSKNELANSKLGPREPPTLISHFGGMTWGNLCGQTLFALAIDTLYTPEEVFLNRGDQKQSPKFELSKRENWEIYFVPQKSIYKEGLGTTENTINR